MDSAKLAIGVFGAASLVSDTNCPAGFTFLLGCFDLLRALSFVHSKKLVHAEKTSLQKARRIVLILRPLSHAIAG
jgi:hypothetical protein